MSCKVSADCQLPSGSSPARDTRRKKSSSRSAGRGRNRRDRSSGAASASLFGGSFTIMRKAFPWTCEPFPPPVLKGCVSPVLSQQFLVDGFGHAVCTLQEWKVGDDPGARRIGPRPCVAFRRGCEADQLRFCLFSGDCAMARVAGPPLVSRSRNFRLILTWRSAFPNIDQA